MQIGHRLRELREAKKLSQGDIEKRTGLLRCYTSRVENGYTIPSVQTLEKYASALEVPLYMVFCDGSGPMKNQSFPKTKAISEWGTRGRENRELKLFARALSRMKDRDRQILLFMTSKMATRKKK